MIDLFKKHVSWKCLVYIRPSFLTLFLDELKTQEMCNEAVRIDPWLLYNIPNYLETQKMCNEAVRIDPWLLCDIPDYLKTQKMCNEVIKKAPWMQFDAPDRFRNLGMSIRAPLRLIPLDHPKTQGVCERAVEKDP